MTSFSAGLPIVHIGARTFNLATIAGVDVSRAYNPGNYSLSVPPSYRATYEDRRFTLHLIGGHPLMFDSRDADEFNAWMTAAAPTLSFAAIHPFYFNVPLIAFINFEGARDENGRYLTDEPGRSIELGLVDGTSFTYCDREADQLNAWFHQVTGRRIVTP